jgi:outer membrane protein, multidrug efflux system
MIMYQEVKKMNRNLLFLLFAIVIYITGCSMSPKYTRPEAPIASEWPFGRVCQESKTAVIALKASELRWQEFFIDERLKELIHKALNNNRDLRLAALNAEKARVLYGIQRKELFPSVNAIGSGMRQRVPADISNTANAVTSEQYSVDLGISSWEIDFFGRIRTLKDKALEQYLATEQAQRSAQVALISAIADAYMNLAADRGHVKLAKSTLEAQRKSYELIRRRCKVGLAPELDLRRAQTQVAIALGDIARFKQVVAQDENALNLLVGSSSPLPDEVLPEDLTSIKAPKEISPGIPSEVLLNRPDILAGEHRLKAANANIGAARASLFPRIALTTYLGTASSELSGLFKAGSRTWSFAPQITMPIFDSRLWLAYKATKVEREIALTEYERAIQVAFREVADVLSVLETVESQLSAQKSVVGSVAETYRLSKTLYNKGIDSYLSVLDAQRSLYSAEQGLISISLARLVNKVRLYAVLGGGGNLTAKEPPGSP